jgi:hypothetical protein
MRPSRSLDPEQIRAAIVKAALLEAELPVDVANGAAFHLTDWVEDLEAFVSFCCDPTSYTPEQVNELLLAFLIHAPNHLAAAAKLYADMPVRDVFGVGSTAELSDGDL